MRDPYLYPDSEVLKNIFDVMDDKTLRGLEADYVVLRLSEIAVDEPINIFNFASLCGLHYRIFQDVFEWAGKPRIINIEKAETALNGISVEYSDVFDIEKDAQSVLYDMNEFQWEQASFGVKVTTFSDYMAKLWKVHPFREGNTRTIVTFCAMFIEAQGIYIDSELFKDNAEYMRDALVAASAIFSDLGDRRKPEYLYRIVEDALERGNQIKEDVSGRIKKAGFSANFEQIREIIFWDRKDKRPHNEAEIQEFLKR